METERLSKLRNGLVQFLGAKRPAKVSIDALIISLSHIVLEEF